MILTDVGGESVDTGAGGGGGGKSIKVRATEHVAFTHNARGNSHGANGCIEFCVRGG